MITKGLPIGFVPHQGVIALVRIDMVDNRSGSDLALFLAHTAQRMLGKEPCSCLLPSVSVSTLSGAFAGSPAIRVDRLYRPSLCRLDTWLDGSEPPFTHSLEPSK